MSIQKEREEFFERWCRAAFADEEPPSDQEKTPMSHLLPKPKPPSTYSCPQCGALCMTINSYCSRCGCNRPNDLKS